MGSKSTLRLKNSSGDTHKKYPLNLIGKQVSIQTKSPSVLNGKLMGVQGNVLVLEDCAERRWLDGQESAQVRIHKQLYVERQVVNFISVVGDAR